MTLFGLEMAVLRAGCRFRHSGADGTKLNPPRCPSITGQIHRASVAERHAALPLASDGAHIGISHLQVGWQPTDLAEIYNAGR